MHTQAAAAPTLAERELSHLIAKLPNAERIGMRDLFEETVANFCRAGYGHNSAADIALERVRRVLSRRPKEEAK